MKQRGGPKSPVSQHSASSLRRLRDSIKRLFSRRPLEAVLENRFVGGMFVGLAVVAQRHANDTRLRMFGDPDNGKSLTGDRTLTRRQDLNGTPLLVLDEIVKFIGDFESRRYTCHQLMIGFNHGDFKLAVFFV